MILHSAILRNQMSNRLQSGSMLNQGTSFIVFSIVKGKEPSQWLLMLVNILCPSSYKYFIVPAIISSSSSFGLTIELQSSPVFSSMPSLSFLSCLNYYSCYERFSCGLDSNLPFLHSLILRFWGISYTIRSSLSVEVDKEHDVPSYSSMFGSLCSRQSNLWDYLPSHSMGI